MSNKLDFELEDEEDFEEQLLTLKIEVIEYITYNKLEKAQIIEIAQILGIDIPEDLE